MFQHPLGEFLGFVGADLGVGGHGHLTPGAYAAFHDFVSQFGFDVFLAFVRYSQGPLPEDLLPQLQCPVWIIWGQDDPWEPVALGRSFTTYAAVRAMEELPGVGHCPQDEAPELVNPLVLGWLAAAEA